VPDVGPCAPWNFECACCRIDGASPAVTGMAVMAATEVLWAASGRRFGECAVTGLMPCTDQCDGWSSGWLNPIGSWGQYPNPALLGGRWFNLGCGGCSGSCSCNTRSQFTLPEPVNSVTRIMIAGSPVPTGSYRLENWRYVVRIDGGEWPLCNDGSWTVDVSLGNPVPQLGLLAAAELACEMVKACTGDRSCRLPVRLQSLTRQGVAQQFLDPQEFFKEGRVGLYLSDQFIKTFNPSGLHARPLVLSPDRLPPRRVT
jgi:hypothetical protein